MKFGTSPIFLAVTPMGDELDTAGLSSASIRIGLGSADELTLEMPSQDGAYAWRPDMPVWQVGAAVSVFIGYDGDPAYLQTFELVSTTNSYGESGTPSMTVRGVSELARCARNRGPRVFSGKRDSEIVDAVCQEYGWTNGVDGTLLINRQHRLKESGVSDLDLLRQIAKEARLGAPRVLSDRKLVMPIPVAEFPPVFTRGDSAVGDAPLLSFSPNREGGHVNTQLVITAWDPVGKQFVESVFEADEFSNDPKLVYSGPAAYAPISSESSTRGLILQVIESRGHQFGTVESATSAGVASRASGRTGGEKVKEVDPGKKKPKSKRVKPTSDERVDVLASGVYLDETDAAALARRWFELRERLSRWATADVPGHVDLQPYQAVRVDGALANMDRGLWLPTVIEHSVGSDGWRSKLTMIRIVEEGVVTPS